MRFIDEFRNRKDIGHLSDAIHRVSRKPVSIMEICGGHTMAIHRFGIPSLLPDTIDLITGPGCPVCVTPVTFVDRIIALSGMSDVIIATYGDFIRIPGSTSSLEKERASGADVRIVYSTLDAVEIAASEKNKKVIFPAIGFETTSPATAASIIESDRRGIRNFFILSSHKTMPNAMMALIDDGVKIDGYICPGHVSVITGIGMYRPVVDRYHLPCVVSGFEPADIMMSIYMLVMQIESGISSVQIAYSRAVKPEGNPVARRITDSVFVQTDAEWRGLGLIRGSGLALRDEFSAFDASRIGVDVEDSCEPAGCICGQILKGLRKPFHCPLFGDKCIPENPVGACMVSSEGTCAAYYRYERKV